MNATLISKEKTDVKLSFEVDAETLEKGLKFAYEKQKSRIAIPGFRKGKVPRKVIEAQYGDGFFFEEAINHLFPENYKSAVDELDLDIVSSPTLDMEYIEKGKGAKFIVEVTVKPEVKLGEYKGLKTDKIAVAVEDEAVMEEIEAVRGRNARKVDVTDRAAQIGDIVKLSYDGSVDGVHFDGGQSDEHDLELGSNSFIPGFEEQVAGHSVGESFDVNVKFPEEYHAKDLAGKDAVFAIEIKKITAKEMPELDDEFAEDVSEFSTFAEYKASVLDKLTEAKQAEATRDEQEKLMDLAVETCEMDVPQVMFTNRIDGMMHEFEQNISRQGLNIQLYCQYLGTSVEEMRENFKETAEKSVKARLMLEEIAKQENITISEEALNEEIGKYGESYGLPAEKMLEIIREEDKEALKNDMLVKAAADVIYDAATIA